MTRQAKESRFAVVVRFEKTWLKEAEQAARAPLVYWHRSPAAAARRLASLISKKAKWVPAQVKEGTRFYIVDHASADKTQYPLNAFYAAFKLESSSCVL